MVTDFALSQMATDTNYPSATGLTLSMSSSLDSTFANPVFMQADLFIGGTPGTTASYQVQIQRLKGGAWLNATNLLLSGNGSAATGHASARIRATAVRLVAVNGTTPGTGVNTPKYHLGLREITARHSGT